MTSAAPSFEGFVCWDREQVHQTVFTEAVNPDAAVFLATHQPLSVQRRSSLDAPVGEVVNEHAVFDDFLSRRPVEGLMIMPVVGPSGSGKSHLVRWVRERMRASQERPFVYIQKTDTSLRQVIETILKGWHSLLADKIRQNLEQASSTYSEQTLPGVLLDQLAHGIENGQDEGRTAPDDEIVEYLRLDSSLPGLLRDVVFRQQWLATDGPIRRLAMEILHGRTSEGKDQQFEFTAADLPKFTQAKDASRPAQEFFRHFTSDADMVTAAVGLLNANLNPAVRRLHNLGGGQLKQAMLDIRRELLARGEELILLIEDFAILQGIQGELLDAISETSVREGRMELAPIRTLLAVTDGYWRTVVGSTVGTRAEASVPYYYVLGSVVGKGGVSGDYVADFAGRYLNAARVGAEEIRQGFDSTTDVDSRAWVSNHCEDCPVRTKCFEAFGHSSDEYGLYPFNRSALLWTLRSRKGSQFDPRALLGQVLRPVLDRWDTDIRNGQFPPPAFREHFPPANGVPALSPEVGDDLERLDPANAARRKVLLEVWAGAPSQACNLPPGLHVAFGLPPLANLQVPPPPRPAGQTGTRERTQDKGEAPPPPPAPAATSSTLQRKLAAIDAWATRGDLLPQAVAREIRNVLHDAVLARVDWNQCLTVKPGSDRMQVLFRRSISIEIDNAGGGKTPGLSQCLRLPIPGSAGTAVLLKALLRAQDQGSWRFDRGPEQFRRYCRLVEDWSGRLVEHVRRQMEADDPEVMRGAAETLLVSARVLAVRGSGARSAKELLAAMFAFPDDTTASARPTDSQIVKWRQLVEVVERDRRGLAQQLLGLIGAAQGSGAPQVIMVDALLPHIRAFATHGTFSPTRTPLPEWVDTPQRTLVTRFDQAVSARLANMSDWHKNVVRQVPSAAEAEATLAALRAAFDGALTAGVLDLRGDPQQVESRLREGRKLPWTAIDIVANLVAGDTSAGGQLRRAAGDPERARLHISEFLDQCEWVTKSLRRAQTRLATTGAVANTQQLRPVLSAWTAALESINAMKNGGPS